MKIGDWEAEEKARFKAWLERESSPDAIAERQRVIDRINEVRRAYAESQRER